MNIRNIFARLIARKPMPRVVFALLIFASFALVAFARAEAMTTPTFLTWLATAGGAATAFSFFAERNPAFQKQNKDVKGYIQLGGSLLLAVVAYLALTMTPAETMKQVEPFFQLAYGIVGTWIVNQVAHNQDPHAAPPESPAPPKA